jgi:hypothetical protein
MENYVGLAIGFNVYLDFADHRSCAECNNYLPKGDWQ